MHWTRPTITSVLLLTFTLPGRAEELPELLQPVDPAVEAQLMAKSNFDFRQQRYSAYRQSDRTSLEWRYLQGWDSHSSEAGASGIDWPLRGREPPKSGLELNCL
jgi:hypothetical protein